MYHSRHRRPRKKGKFDPDDATKVRHTQIGVWDLYEEINPALDNIPGSSRLESFLEAFNTYPFVWRMLKDIASIRHCWSLLALYFATQIVAALIPAVSLWYSGQLLDIVRIAVEERTVDKGLLIRVATAKLGCSLLQRFVRIAELGLTTPVNHSIKRFYSKHFFHAMVRLDVPTFDDSLVQRQLEQSMSPNSSSSIAWDTVSTFIRVIRTCVQVLSQVSVLAAVLRSQPDGVLLCSLSLIRTFFQWKTWSPIIRQRGVWAATTTNQDYIRMEGLKRVVNDPEHRQELVAGGMWSYLLDLYRRSSDSVGDNGQSFNDAFRVYRQTRLHLGAFVQDVISELPQIVFTLRAVRYPASIPISLASLNLITQTTDSFLLTLVNLFSATGSIADQLLGVRKLYEVSEIRNRIPDGTIPFPENSTSLNLGVSIEFRNVSFKYPESQSYALKNVSFKIEKGQLCVIVGQNGSGKSTILKLIARLYDPAEGEIFIDNHDIKTLRLDDLRRATSVLFQDYTHFPLSLKDNIGLGDPEHAEDEDKITQAAKLGGADEFINKLPDSFNTYLNRPVKDHYSGLPEGTTTLFGRSVDYGKVKQAAGVSSKNSTSLSGGQMQRIALSRTFMRSVVSEGGVGILLFDEPSASLDPTAEHDLFERLRQLRGNKTMVFSSHRFGNLTRHADLILYIHDSLVLEKGTHDELVQKKGEYARIWMLQAQQFLP